MVPGQACAASDGCPGRTLTPPQPSCGDARDARDTVSPAVGADKPRSLQTDRDRVAAHFRAKLEALTPVNA